MAWAMRSGNMPAPAAAVATTEAAPVAAQINGNGGGVPSMDRVMQIGQRAVAAFQRGASGDDFASALVTLEDDGEQLYVMLAGFGKDGIVQALKGSPAWPALASRETEIAAWLDDFLAYGQADESGGGA